MNSNSDFDKTVDNEANAISFGSCISFKLPNKIDNANNNDYLTFSGFLANKIQTHDYSVHKIMDIEFCFSLFKIFPFDESNFKYQHLIKKHLVDNEQDFKTLGFLVK